MVNRKRDEQNWTLSTNQSQAHFDVRQGRLTSLVLGGHQLLVSDDGSGPWSWGGFVMAPWTSLVRDATFRFAGSEHHLTTDDGPHAVLGLTWKLPWLRTGNRLVCDLTSGRDFGWPFGGTVWQEPRLTPAGFELTLGLSPGADVMPAAIGWHPWFRRSLDVGGAVDLALPVGSWRQGRDGAERPDGTCTAVEAGAQQHNDCLQTPGPTRLVWPGCGVLEVHGSTPWTTIYSTNPRGVCVEPVTSPAEQMNHVLRPGEVLECRVSLRWVPN
jgi:aldose 1-epimerase